LGSGPQVPHRRAPRPDVWHRTPPRPVRLRVDRSARGLHPPGAHRRPWRAGCHRRRAQRDRNGRSAHSALAHVDSFLSHTPTPALCSDRLALACARPFSPDVNIQISSTRSRSSDATPSRWRASRPAPLASSRRRSRF
jgi:hypothetical protein